jgi:hypothetical protein
MACGTMAVLRYMQNDETRLIPILFLSALQIYSNFPLLTHRNGTPTHAICQQKENMSLNSQTLSAVPVNEMFILIRKTYFRICSKGLQAS